MRAAPLTILTFALLMPTTTSAQTLRIDLEHDSEAEQATRAQLVRLLEEHDVERWLFTRSIRIDQTQIPHSHPVLTLHTRHLNDDHELLSTFIHEQYHWFVSDRDAQEEAAIADFRALFPDAPGREGRGARDPYSTYLHLIVCDMEFQGMTALYGEDVAREVLGAITHYEWIYERVLTDPRIREVNRKHGFIVP